MSGCGARGVARVLAPLLRLYASAVRGGEAEEAGGAGGAGAGAGALAVVDMFRELVGVLDGLAPDADGGRDGGGGGGGTAWGDVREAARVELLAAPPPPPSPPFPY